MAVSEFPEYLRHIQNALNDVIAEGRGLTLQLEADQRSMIRGFLAGVLVFADGSELHFREYIDLSASEPRLMYAYHYQDADAQLVFRYDNAAHRPPLQSREHKHLPNRIELVLPPTLLKVIDEILERRI